MSDMVSIGKSFTYRMTAEAVQWDGTNMQDVATVAGEHKVKWSGNNFVGVRLYVLTTHRGEVSIPCGDYILKLPDGSINLVARAGFEACWEKVTMPEVTPA